MAGPRVLALLIFFFITPTWSQDPQCPKAEDIAPCECKIFGEGSIYAYLSLNCTDVKDEDELARVFMAEFPTTYIGNLHFDDNKGIQVLKDGVFGNVTFEVVQYFGGVLETIEAGVFEKSQQTLLYIFMRQWEGAPNFLTKFNLDGTFEIMDRFDLRYTNVSEFPMINFPKIKHLTLENNQFTISENAFSQMPWLENLYLSYTGSNTLPDVLFTDININLDDIYISNNDITYLQVGPFENASIRSTLFLDFNDDTFEMEEGALDSLKEMYLIMSETYMPILEEHLWRPVLDNTVVLVVKEITCDCSVKWLVSNPPLIDQVQYTENGYDFQPAKCSSGDNLADLDPADFENC